jgi:hypothetical protein
MAVHVGLGGQSQSVRTTRLRAARIAADLESVSWYSNTWINMRDDNALISAFSELER